MPRLILLLALLFLSGCVSDSLRRLGALEAPARLRFLPEASAGWYCEQEITHPGGEPLTLRTAIVGETDQDWFVEYRDHMLAQLAPKALFALVVDKQTGRVRRARCGIPPQPELISLPIRPLGTLDRPDGTEKALSLPVGRVPAARWSSRFGEVWIGLDDEWRGVPLRFAGRDDGELQSRSEEGEGVLVLDYGRQKRWLSEDPLVRCFVPIGPRYGLLRHKRQGSFGSEVTQRGRDAKPALPW